VRARVQGAPDRTKAQSPIPFLTSDTADLAIIDDLVEIKALG